MYSYSLNGFLPNHFIKPCTSLPDQATQHLTLLGCSQMLAPKPHLYRLSMLHVYCYIITVYSLSFVTDYKLIISISYTRE